VIDLSETYRHLGHVWTHEELAVRYSAAGRRGEQLLSESTHTVPERPIALLASAIPFAATLSVAIHLVHALPGSAQTKLAGELLATAKTNAADALHRCHRELELDGHAHNYSAAEWLPVVYDAAAPLLEASRLDQEPPSLVRQTQEAMRWLSTSIALPRRGLSRDPRGPRRHARSPARRVGVRRRRLHAFRVATLRCGRYLRDASACLEAAGSVARLASGDYEGSRLQRAETCNASSAVTGV
jgi:hypothetical protein